MYNSRKIVYLYNGYVHPYSCVKFVQTYVYTDIFNLKVWWSLATENILLQPRMFIGDNAVVYEQYVC
jgi:hypothetical protein